MLATASEAALVFVFAAGAAGPAAAEQPPPQTVTTTQAEEDDDNTDRVIVTARKRQETLNDIPVSGTVIGEETIADIGGLVDPNQLGELLTGVSIDDEGNAEYFIRGAGTGRGQLAASATTQMRNGAEIAGGFGGRAYQRIDQFDTRQIELYRGAQGSLYGRNAVGGVFNLINNAPVGNFEYSLLTSYDFTKGETRLEGIVNTPLIEDRLFLRVGLMAEDEKGLYTNDFFDEPGVPYALGGARVA